MKRLLALLTITAGNAGAHTLDAGEGLVSQLGHELLGWHHLPLTLLLLVVGVVAWRSLRARRRS